MTISTRSRLRLGREHMTADVLAALLKPYGELRHRLEYSHTVYTGFPDGEWRADHVFRVL